MSKQRVNSNVLSVLTQGLQIYFSNIDKFLIYMLFPVFGQLIGLVLAFCLPLALAHTIADKVDNPVSAMIYLLILAAPGLLIFTKAFWDYMVAYVALNSMTEGAITSGKVYDFQSHNEVATRRTFNYVIFLLVTGALISVGSTIFFIIPGFIVWIYLILSYQVFTFEPDLNLSDIFKRSFMLIRGNWLKTVILLAILAFFSIYLIVQGTTVVADFLNLTGFLVSVLDEYTSQLPVEYVNDALTYFNLPNITPSMISQSILYSLLSYIVTGLTLPVRSICWTIWYRNLSGAQQKAAAKPVKSAKKKPERKED